MEPQENPQHDQLNPADLFPEQGPAQPEPAPAQATPPAPSAEVESLRAQVGQLTTLVGQIFQSGFQRPQEQAPPQHDPYESLKQPGQFFTDEDADLLLNTQKPTEALNRMANRVRDAVATPLLQTIQSQQAQMAQEWQAQQQRQHAAQMEAAGRANAERFYQANPHLREHDAIVKTVAQDLYMEGQRNPYMLAGKSDTDIHAMIAARAKSIMDKIRGGAQPADQQQQAQTPAARSTYMERGSGTRVPAATQPKDTNERALKDMNEFMRGKGTRPARGAGA